MRKALLAVTLMALPVLAEAQATVNCSVSGLNARQTQLLADFLASVNAGRAAQTPSLPPYADFPAYCSATMVSAVTAYIQQQNKVDTEKVATQADLHGQETAPNAQCSAAGLPNGCKKVQVACFILSGSATCP